jgi:hypothetical protein
MHVISVPTWDSLRFGHSAVQPEGRAFSQKKSIRQKGIHSDHPTGGEPVESPIYTALGASDNSGNFKLNQW